MTPNVCSYPRGLGRINLLWSAPKWAPLQSFFGENVQYVEFPINVENLYFVEMGAFSDVVIAENYVFHPLFCEGF